MITPKCKHDKHPIRINYAHTNAHGQPALYCEQSNKWIQWISKADLPVLERCFEVEAVSVTKG